MPGVKAVFEVRKVTCGWRLEPVEPVETVERGVCVCPFTVALREIVSVKIGSGW